MSFLFTTSRLKLFVARGRPLVMETFRAKAPHVYTPRITGRTITTNCLRVKRPYLDRTALSLTRTPKLATAEIAEPLDILRLDTIDSTDYWTIYRATVAIGQPAATKTFILKEYLRDREAQALMDTEVSCYMTAHSVQGQVIPTFYGLYRGECPEKGLSMLLFEDCGDPRIVWPRNTSDVDSMRIVKQLTRLHDAGIEHGDPDWVNIVWQRQKLEGEDEHVEIPMFVNLEAGEPHFCERQMPIVFGAWQPWDWAFNCREIYNLASELDVWTNPKFYFENDFIPIFDIKGPEDLFKRCPASRRIEETWAYVQKRQDILQQIEEDGKLAWDTVPSAAPKRPAPDS